MFGEGAVEDDENLFDASIIDSLGLLKLLAFIEEKLKISVDMADVTMENFSTINKMVKALETKIKK